MVLTLVRASILLFPDIETDLLEITTDLLREIKTALLEIVRLPWGAWSQDLSYKVANNYQPNEGLIVLVS